MALAKAELERGWAEFECPDHGFLVSTHRAARVVCKCKKRARKTPAFKPFSTLAEYAGADLSMKTAISDTTPRSEGRRPLDGRRGET